MTIKLTDDAYEELALAAEKRGMTMTALIRRALATEKFFQEHKKAQILLREGGETREVVLLDS